MKQFKKFYFELLTVFVAISIAIPTHSKNTCENLFENRTKFQKITHLFIKDAPKNPVPTQLLGLATEIQGDRGTGIFSRGIYYTFDFIPEKLGHLITLNRNYAFTPFKAIDENLFDKPTGYISEKLIGKKKELGLLIKLPLIALLSVSAWNSIDQRLFWPEVEKRVTEQVLMQTEANAAYFDKLIDTDFRFQDIKNTKLKNLKKTPDTVYDGKNIQEYINTPKVNARFLAYDLKQSYENYFKVYSQIPTPQTLTLEENFTLFGTNKIFEHLNFFFENGAKQFEGTFVPTQNQGPLSDFQKKELFDLTHLLYAKYLIIDVLFDDKTNLKNLLSRNPLAIAIYNDPYSQTLIALYKNGKISKEKLIYYMHEDAKHSYYMSLFKSMNIVNFKPENGSYTKEPLTLQDLRESRLSNLH